MKASSMLLTWQAPSQTPSTAAEAGAQHPHMGAPACLVGWAVPVPGDELRLSHGCPQALLAGSRLAPTGQWQPTPLQLKVAAAVCLKASTTCTSQTAWHLKNHPWNGQLPKSKSTLTWVPVSCRTELTSNCHCKGATEGHNTLQESWTSRYCFIVRWWILCWCAFNLNMVGLKTPGYGYVTGIFKQRIQNWRT